MSKFMCKNVSEGQKMSQCGSKNVNVDAKSHETLSKGIKLKSII